MNATAISTPPTMNSVTGFEEVRKNQTLDLPKQKAGTAAVSELTVLSDKKISNTSLSQDDQQALKRAEVAINDALLSRLNQKLSFSIDENTGKTVIKILDKQTDEVVKQFPPQEFLDMVYNLNKAASVVLKDMPRYI
jgi:flagellar protein FlaG